MDVTHLADWFDIIYKGLTALFVVWMFFDRKNDKTHARISEVEKRFDGRMDNHATRISRIESDIENGIGVDDIKAIHKRIDEILKASSKTEGQLEMLNTSVKSITEYFINGSKK